MDFKKFPTTRYQGSKKKILPWIYENLKSLRFQTALDACGGSGSVSYLLKKMGKSVTYNDKLHFNYLIGKALIENNHTSLSTEDINSLLLLNQTTNSKEVISENFKNIYYLNKENKWLDNVTQNIINMNHYPNNVLDMKRALAFYCLFQSCLIKRPFNLFHRKNLNIRTANVERNFGNKSTWDKPFEKYFKHFASEINGLIFDSGKECFATNESIFDIDPYGFDLVYIDLPYIQKSGISESSNYLKIYHFLEGISRYDEWSDLIDYNTINHRLMDIEGQNDFTRRNMREKIEEIFLKFQKNKIVFSYKKGGTPSVESIKKLLEKSGKRVYSKSVHYKYALNHQNGDSKNNREVLIIGV